jgi:hypothetical protein
VKVDVTEEEPPKAITDPSLLDASKDWQEFSDNSEYLDLTSDNPYGLEPGMYQIENE